MLNDLVPFKDRLSNSRVYVNIDNQVLKSGLDDDGCKNSAINDVIKEILCHIRDCNFSILTFYVPSERNPADEPPRRCSDLDCTLSPKSWSLAERFVGPYSFYLMAVDSNCQRDFRVNPLPHYAPWPTPGSDGVNVFANPLPAGNNIYSFPPFVVLGPLLHYIFDQDFHGAFKLVVSDLRPRPFWWATLHLSLLTVLLLGKKGSISMLLFPTLNSREWLPCSLRWEL